MQWLGNTAQMITMTIGSCYMWKIPVPVQFDSSWQSDVFIWTQIIFCGSSEQENILYTKQNIQIDKFKKINSMISLLNGTAYSFQCPLPFSCMANLFNLGKEMLFKLARPEFGLSFRPILFNRPKETGLWQLDCNNETVFSIISRLFVIDILISYHTASLNSYKHN